MEQKELTLEELDTGIHDKVIKWARLLYQKACLEPGINLRALAPYSILRSVERQEELMQRQEELMRRQEKVMLRMEKQQKVMTGLTIAIAVLTLAVVTLTLTTVSPRFANWVGGIF